MIRRDFLKNISLMTAGGLLAGKASAAVAATGAEAPMPHASKSFGLQIYSLQQELYNDLPARLKEVKAMGYERLELAGYGKGKIGKVDMMEFKKMAEDAGLKIVS